MSGSIAAYKVCHVISSLVQQGHEVQIAATKSCLQFIGEATLEGLSGKKVKHNLWEPGTMMDHIHLIRWADCILFAPATANQLNKLSAGIADDLISTLFLAHDFKKPFIVAPAMNTSMYSHPITQASIQNLEKMGIQFIQPESGTLACGEEGLGRLASPEIILSKINSVLSLGKKVITHRKKILITSGGTSEKIDNVRRITNTSTGYTGSIIAESLATNEDYDVLFLAAENSILPKNKNLKITYFNDYVSLESQLKTILKSENINTLIMAAAVSDYSIDQITQDNQVIQANKISSGSPLTIRLKPNDKIIDKVKDWSISPLQVISFKLTSNASDTEIKSHILKQLKNSDIVIHNDLSEIQSYRQKHIFRLYNKEFIEHAFSECHSAEELAKTIHNNFLTTKDNLI